jgi:hypothetical protein
MIAAYLLDSGQNGRILGSIAMERSGTCSAPREFFRNSVRRSETAVLL